MSFKSELMTQLSRKHLADNPDANFGDYMETFALEHAKHEVDVASDTCSHGAIAWENREIARAEAQFALCAK